MTLMSISAFALMSLGYLYGDYQLSDYAKTNSLSSLSLSIASLISANILLIYLLKLSPYGVLMVVSTLVILIGNVLISLFALNEEYSATQSLGIVLAALAVLLVGFGGHDGSGGAAA